ncbi:MAG TPA: nucleotidyl transferase AbiEii/AbiGii toxin family protein [Methylomirabilota bacterium]|nr:nucleotidyl transferase AbiEii/AbiGii toxin family protein [Methylomirabilota bacterium]
MNKVATMDASARAELFGETAARKNLAEAIIEKDFWVCWVLKQLFSNRAFEGRLLFKGGTSLSKIFHAIKRFSEDIDLAVDYVALGFTGDKDPRQEDISKTKRNAILDEMMGTCRGYIAGEFLGTFRQQCAALLGPGDAWGLDVSKSDPNTVEFRYPVAGTKGLDYVNPRVVLELGTHAEFVPHDQFTIRSFAGEEFPNVVRDRDISVTALLAKRTFWEKATILHAEYHRPAERPLPERYSRHYYDVAMMGEGKIKDEALADKELLPQVVKHKETFYPSAWARYDLARRGNLRLVSPDSRIAALEQDYKKMGVMIFGEQPPFGWVLDQLGALEKEINK